MISLDWIPVICRKIGRHNVGRRYVYNRLHELREALADWLARQNRCAEKLKRFLIMNHDRSNAAAFSCLLSRELTLLKIAVSHLEFWANGGSDISLNRAQKAYAQAQSMWKRRMFMLQKITVYPQQFV